MKNRITRLEIQLDKIGKRTHEPAKDASGSERVDTAKLVRQNQIRILDPQLDEQEKVKAWSAPRSLGKDAWTDNVVFEMNRIGLTSHDPLIRANVWRQAHGRSKSLLLVPALRKALRGDLSAKVREEAAETLADDTEDPTVMNAPGHAEQNDKDEGVRRQASSSLKRKRRQGTGPARLPAFNVISQWRGV